MTARIATLALPADDARQIFTRPAQDGINAGRAATYRVAHIGVYDDGSFWVWAEQITKAGRAYKSGIGLNLGNEDRLAEIYGQDVADVVADAIAAHRAETAAVEVSRDPADVRAALATSPVAYVAADVEPCESPACRYGDHTYCPGTAEDDER